MTEVADTYLGNITQDRDLAQKVASAKKTGAILEVNLQESDRKKGRIFTQSTCGKTLGIVKNRDLQLQEGDIFQTQKANLLLIHLEAETLMVLSFAMEVNSQSAMKLISLGHLLGNQHYPIKIEENKVYVRLAKDTRVITQAIAKLTIPDLKITWEKSSIFKDTLNIISHHHE